MKHSIYILFIVLVSVSASLAIAQEKLAPVGYNPQLKNAAGISNPLSPVAKTTALSLPFFEDFTGYSLRPDSNKWLDDKVYINNTMSINPISRGVATFDALDSHGLPYNPKVSTALVYADTLTSKAIDLSSNNPGDSVYLSFFYQPQGNGFSPEASDSLMLYLRKNNNAFVRVWSKEGTLLQPFQQVMIPIADTSYFHANFQIRFINKASINTNDDVWNVDYIRIATGRTMYDTVVNDVAFTYNPDYILKDFTYMPYTQFMANPSGERITQHLASLRNNTTTAQIVTYNYTAKEISTNTPLFTNGSNNVSITPLSPQQVSLNTYSNTIPASTGEHKWIDFQNKYYIESVSPTDPKENDTIIRDQVFHNYLAYDDGTAEKSYYLNLFPTLPGKLAVDYRLNIPDTLSGIAIYFGRQVPMAYDKYFSAVVYKDLTSNGGAGQVIYQQDFLNPAYSDVNGYWIYKFDSPILLPAGTFYIGTIQPALSNSDSLYFGFDVNRTGNNHLHYNVVGNWESSTLSGAVMIRPILGPIIPTTVKHIDTKFEEVKWSVSPGPVADVLQFHFDSGKQSTYELYDMQGRVLLKGNVSAEERLNVSHLTSGMYFIRLTVNGVASAPKKIVKL